MASESQGGQFLWASLGAVKTFPGTLRENLFSPEPLREEAGESEKARQRFSSVVSHQEAVTVCLRGGGGGEVNPQKRGCLTSDVKDPEYGCLQSLLPWRQEPGV